MNFINNEYKNGQKIDADMRVMVDSFSADYMTIFQEWAFSLSGLEWLEVSCDRDHEYDIMDFYDIFPITEDFVSVKTSKGTFKESDYIRIIACGNSDGEWYQEIGTFEIVAANGNYLLDC